MSEGGAVLCWESRQRKEAIGLLPNHKQISTGEVGMLQDHQVQMICQ